ncbi:MAG: hypothetical protein KGH98_00735 [Candidatus Micrarchaeota archaeon]|nr:hypothetical protein [Candidatus Micrarchaeota archaeon]
MLQLYIPAERIKRLKDDSESMRKVERTTKCKLSISPDIIDIDGEAYGEFIAKNVLYAYGRGFDMDKAMLLCSDDYYFSVIDLGLLFGNDKRIQQVKARVIGKEGRAKRYIESVSSAHISVYGDTIAIIGKIGEVTEAETAINSILAGGTHRVAYRRMESAHRKNSDSVKDASF